MNIYNLEERKILLDLASKSIYEGLENKKLLEIDKNDYPEKLTNTLACFVTLQLKGNLRGCIGSLEAHRALVNDVVHNAYSAAFNDYRFSPLTKEEYSNLEISISVLSKPEPLEFSSEQDLINKIRPQVDGLILSSGANKGTFLPSVWEQIPTAKEFLRHLKNKAGLPSDYWSEQIKILRYTAEYIQK